uniref:Uncharacterized protein n=1 Tax=Mycena chlorophos TaxID=658473 RepID=A0ABQ0KVY3_MYCCL|nr:predicted protein [Mycena chlorophos]
MNAIRAQAPDPDRIPRIKLANETPKQAWWFMGTLIALVAIHCGEKRWCSAVPESTEKKYPGYCLAVP